MISSKKYQQIYRIHSTDHIIITSDESTSIINKDFSLTKIINDNVYYSRVINNQYFFQLHDENNLSTILKNKTVSKNGTWGLISAFPISEDRFYIYHSSDKNKTEFKIIDRNLETIQNTIKGCNHGGNSSILRVYGQKITCFEIDSSNLMWEAIHNSTIKFNFILDSLNLIYSRTDDGILYTRDLGNGDIKWTLNRAGRLTVYNNLIYSVADQILREINAETGEIQSQKSIKDLETKFNFFPTGEHKVYDDYIFIMAAGKPGKVAIYDRKTFEFKYMIKLDELIPIGKDHLHWHDGKLYILDFGNTLHVFEEEPA